MQPIPEYNNYGGYQQAYFDPAVAGYPSIYNEYVAPNQPLASYQGIENCGYDVNGQYENIPIGSLPDMSSGKDPSIYWNPINLAKLYPKLYLSPSGSYSNTPFKNTPIQLPKNVAKLTADKMEEFINPESSPSQNFHARTSGMPQLNKDVWRKIFKAMSTRKFANKHNETDNSSFYSDSDKASSFNNGKTLRTYNTESKWPGDHVPEKAVPVVSKCQNVSVINVPSMNGETEHLPLPERLVKKKSAQMKALQNLSKLKAMIHIAKEERRTVQHKREESRRQFLSEVAEELQLMSSAKLAEIEASKSYRALLAAEKALSDKDRDIHTLLEKEDALYEDLTDAEASLAKADMNFIPKIKSENELRQFASFLNFGF